MMSPVAMPGSSDTTHQDASAGKVDTHRPSPRRRLSFVAASLTILGLVVGRFATTPRSDEAPATRTQAVQSLVAVNQEAIPRLEAAIRDNPSDVRTLQQLAVAYTRRAAVGDPSNYDLADQTLRRAEKIAPEDVSTLIARASLDLSLHQFDRARDLGIKIHQQNPDLNDAAAVLVDASVELGRYDDAQRYLQELVDRRAALPSYARVSYLRELHGDLSGAATAMQLAINAGQPGSLDVAAVTTLLGDIEFNLGNLDAARSAYTQALRAQSSLPLATVGLAKVDAAQGRIKQAVSSLQSLTERYPLAAAVVLLGDLQDESGDREGAANSFGLVDAIATLQRNAGQVVDLEMAQFDLDHRRIRSGVALAETAYAERPDNVYVTDALAWARFRQGRFVEAQALSTKALRIGTLDPAMRFHAAAIAFANGRRSHAVALLEQSYSRQRYIAFSVRQEREALARALGI